MFFIHITGKLLRNLLTIFIGYSMTTSEIAKLPVGTVLMSMEYIQGVAPEETVKIGTRFTFVKRNKKVTVLRKNGGKEAGVWVEIFNTYNPNFKVIEQ